MQITLEQVKQYLNIDLEYTDEDTLIITLLNMAEDAVKAYCNRPDWRFESDNDIETGVPPRVKQAVLMLVAELYSNRELNVQSTLKQSPVWDLLLGTAINYDSF